jgi:hypothetical protein
MNCIVHEQRSSGFGELVDHPWIKEDGDAPDTPLDNVVLDRLKQFRAMNQFKKAALRVHYLIKAPQIQLLKNSNAYTAEFSL